MEELDKNSSFENWDELAEEESEEYRFKGPKTPLRQFIPALLFCALFILLGSDFFIRNELSHKTITTEEIRAPFTVVYLSPEKEMDSTEFQQLKKRLEENKNFQTSLQTDNDSCLLQNKLSGNKIIVSDSWALEPLLYKYKNDPTIKGIPVKNQEEKPYDFLLHKWNRIRSILLSE